MYDKPTTGTARDMRNCAAEVARKPTAAEYTAKRVAEAASMLLGEIERIEGQYNRLRAHFGIPPEPTSVGCPKDPQASDGMEAELTRLSALIGRLSATVSQMNELV